jgi:hypothetical protein
MKPEAQDITAEFPSPMEEQLRRAAPILPPQLRQSTLMRCAAQAEQRRHQSTSRRLLGALVGVCVLHWIAVSLIDAQRAVPTPQALVAAPTGDESTDNFRQKLQTRSRDLAALLNQPDLNDIWS